MWHFREKPLPAITCAEVPVGQFFIGYDADNTAQLAVMCGFRQQEDARYGLWLTGPNAFTLFDLMYAGRNDLVLKIPLTLADVGLAIPTGQTQNRVNGLPKLGALLVKPEGSFLLVGWPPRFEGGAPGWQRLSFDGMVENPTNSELIFEKWAFTRLDDGGKPIEFFSTP